MIELPKGISGAPRKRPHRLICEECGYPFITKRMPAYTGKPSCRQARSRRRRAGKPPPRFSFQELVSRAGGEVLCNA